MNVLNKQNIMDDEIDVKIEALSIALRGWLNSEESEMKVQQIEEITQKIKELEALK